MFHGTFETTVVLYLCAAVIASLLSLSGASAGWALEEYRAPIMREPPVIDGRLASGEWDGAHSFDGMTWRGRLEDRSARAYVGATETDIYIAVESELPSEGRILAKVDKDIVKVVYDDAIEVFIDPNPGQERSLEFQMLANSAGRHAYIVIPRGGAPEDPDWDGGYEMRHGFTDTRWIAELRIPIARIALGRKATDGSWGISVCRDWKQPWVFSSTGPNFKSAGTRFTFVKREALAVRHEHLTDPFTRDIHTRLVLRNPGATPLRAKAVIDLARNTMPEIANSRTITVAAGRTEVYTFKHSESVSDAFELTLKVASPDGKTVHYSRKVAWGKPRGRRWDTVKIVLLPLDFSFSHYPYLRRIRILADRSGLRKDARLDSLTFTIREKDTKRAVKAITFDRFDGARHEESHDMPELDGAYEIVMTARGENIPEGALVKAFERKRYEWEHNDLGRSTEVYPPFTPIEVRGRTLRTVLREHRLNDLGLLDEVTAKGRQILAAPITFRAKVEGVEQPVRARPLVFREKAGHRVVTESSFSAGALEARATATWDYDGTVKYEMTLQPTRGKVVNELTLEIPLEDRLAPMIHAITEGIRHLPISRRLPEGEGVIWTAGKLKAGDMPKGFCSYVFLGSAHRGLSWFAENDLGWSWDRKTPNLEIVRTGGTLVVRVHLVNKPVVIESARTITFGLLAGPVKPRLPGWRHKWWTDRYTMLGTCINWLGGPGVCGNVHPPGKDTYFWKMIARANVEKVPRDEIEECVRRGLKYYEPYGEDAVERWVRHVRYNVGGSRRGKTQVFYYNRATYNACDEYPTFMNEWVLEDYPRHDFKPHRGEIKIVPSESYIDYALHWYAKSFEHGRNRGVYWDNWYIRPSFNRVMTDAYADEGGKVVPAAGIWGLRELCRRTFVMMNEKGMLPITMPHMTSTNILPMHSFATVQYDWEWKYSRGDVQYRHSREYLQLVSNGELAGVWPVPLGEHGPQAKDEWVQRTFAGVCLVHELLSAGGGKVWKTLRDPLIPVLKDPRVKAYRYWDETPQPVTAGAVGRSAYGAQAGDEDLPMIVYSVPGEIVMAVLCSYSEEDEAATLTIDPKALGFRRRYRVTNLETGEPFETKRNRIRLRVKKHEVIGFRIEP